MPETHLTALLAYTRAWSEPDTEIAKALLLSCWTDESEIIGPGYYFKGTNAVLNEIKRFHTEQPGYKAIMTSGFDSHGCWTRFTVAMVQPDGTRGPEGWDIVEQDTEGKVRRVVTFWGSLPGVGNSSCNANSDA